MAVSNLTVKALYDGDASNVTFAIPFQFIPSRVSEQIQVYSVDVDDVRTLLTEGEDEDYVLDPPYDSITNTAGPANVIMAVAPDAVTRIQIYRELPLKQLFSFSSTGPIPGATLERALDMVVMMIQQLDELAQRALTLSVLNDTAIDNISFPDLEPTSILATDANSVMYWKPQSELTGLPDGGLTGAVAVKASDTDQDVEWDQFAFSGYSARYSEIFDTLNLRETVEQILNLTYTAPAISLAGSGSGTVREKGTSVSNITLTATVTKRSNPIGEVRFYESPATLLDTKTGTIPTGGTETTNYAGPFTDTKAFLAKVDDTLVGGNQTLNTQSNTVTYTFVYPYYYGPGAVGLTPAQVAALTKSVITSTATLGESFTPTNGQVLYFAYPASYGALTSILDQNGFETIADWTLTTANITGLDASAVSYRIYSFNNPLVAGTYSYTFVR
jgi:hypothetical protein